MDFSDMDSEGNITEDEDQEDSEEELKMLVKRQLERKGLVDRIDKRLTSLIFKLNSK